MSISSILNIARSALLAQQRAMAVTAHNVANASTPGYSRQRLNLVAMAPLFGAGGSIGRGVSDEGISRARDQFLDGSFRRESALLGGSNTLRRFLEQIENAVNEPSESGIAAALDEFFNAFSDLSTDPSSAAGRDQVRRAADQFIRLLQQLDGQLRQTRQDAIAQMQVEVTEVNAIAKRIATLNREIREATVREEAVPDLMDQRDLLIDRLSKLVSVAVTQGEDGTIGVIAGNAVLVEGTSAKELVVAHLPNDTYGVRTAGGDELIDLRAGSLQALSELVSDTIPGFIDQLDTFAKAVAVEVNAIHRTGYATTGQTGLDFFDPDGLTAQTISLSEAILESTDAIATGATDQPGDNNIALQIAALGHTGVGALGNQTLRDSYIEFATTIGNVVVEAMQDEATHQTLADHVDAMRLSVSGVSVDEEMVNLINQQHAYSVAAQLVKVADEMIQEVLRLV